MRDSYVFSLRFITSESVRTHVDGRVKVLLTNERIDFVKTSGVPSPESILLSLRCEDVLDCHHLKNGKLSNQQTNDVVSTRVSTSFQRGFTNVGLTSFRQRCFHV